MRKWAEVHGDTVWTIFETADDFTPQFAPPVRAVDVTEVEPEPKPGMVLRDDGQFANAPVTVEPSRRILTKFEFMQRFTPQQWMTAKSDLDFAYFSELMNAATEIDLDHPVISQGLQVMVAKGYLTAEEAAAVVA